MSCSVRDHIPLEQGLRPFINAILTNEHSVRDHIPLEQGLRQRPLNLPRIFIVVRDHIPLEQGLRPAPHGAFHKLYVESQRPYSIRTRIKTFRERMDLVAGFPSETIFH